MTAITVFVFHYRFCILAIVNEAESPIDSVSDRLPDFKQTASAFPFLCREQKSIDEIALKRNENLENVLYHSRSVALLLI